jgi:hypothetical protein
VPPTVAVNCCVADPVVRVTFEGEVIILTGCNEMVALALRVASALLVAVTVTVCVEPINAGAVYRPEGPIDPTCGEIDQVTLESEAPDTTAENC